MQTSANCMLLVPGTKAENGREHYTLARLLALGTEPRSMLIPQERAFWLLEFYRTHEIHLTFGGRILGEEAACAAVISHVRIENQAIGIKLLTDNVGESWDRQIPLSRAEFLLFQMGDPEFEQFAKGKFHSILIINFPDGTTMFFAEQAVGS